MRNYHERSRGPRRPGVALAAAFACAALAWASAAGPAQPLDQDNQRLHRQIAMAKEKAAYVVLDLAGQRLRVMSGGAVLRDFAILDAQIGRPTLLYAAAGSTEPWDEAVRSGARLEPKRTVGRIEMFPAASDDDAAEIPVPAEPEQALPAPDRFVLRYDDGFTIEVRTDATAKADGFWSGLVSGLRARLSDAADVARGVRAPRVRVVLSATDAGALFRSFPTESKLLVL